MLCALHSKVSKPWGKNKEKFLKSSDILRSCFLAISVCYYLFRIIFFFYDSVTATAAKLLQSCSTL